MTSSTREFYKNLADTIIQNAYDTNREVFRAGNEEKSLDLTEDLGDYLPFLAFLGLDEFCKDHVQAVLQRGALPIQHTIKGIPVSSAYEYSDFVFGLLWWAEYVSDDTIRSHAEKLLDQLRDEFYLDKSLIAFRAQVLGIGSIPLPFRDNSIGFFSELFVDAADILKRPDLLETATHIMMSLLSSSSMRKYGILAEYDILGQHMPYMRTRLMKTNSNSFFGALALAEKGVIEYRITARWLERMKAVFYHKGVVYKYAQRSSTGWKRETPSLEATFGLLDCLCDYTQKTGDQHFRHWMMEIADTWLSERGDTGLVPRLISGTATDVDTNTDMAVSLCRISQLTGKQSYKKAAKKIFSAIRKYHYVPGSGLVLSVDIDSGAVLNHSVKTKFNFLAIKALVLEENQWKPYGNKSTEELLKDR